MNDSVSENCDDLKGLQSVPRGFLRILIVRLLRNREMTGTEIMEAFEERSKGKWRPSPGSIYPLLSSLEDEEIIKTVKTEGRSKTYTLSEIGHERLKAIFKHKGEVEDRTRLHRHVWMQMLDSVDQAFFHTHGMRMATDYLEGLIPDLTKPQQQKLNTKIKKLIQHLEKLSIELQGSK
ncbi:MAG: PadR family transcriptional regulator [Candidatus Thorarchaeota archaeon]